MPEFLFSLIFFAAVQVGTPGPANMIVLATSARFGFWASWPFLAGVILGKQAIIWPLGFGLLLILETAPWAFTVLRWAAVTYILWLAWRLTSLRLSDCSDKTNPPGFLSGLIVHPINPKAWGIIITAFTHFLPKNGAGFENTLILALSLFAIQLILQPLWGILGAFIGQKIAGHPYEKYFMWSLAGLVLLSVGAALL